MVFVLHFQSFNLAELNFAKFKNQKMWVMKAFVPISLQAYIPYLFFLSVSLLKKGGEWINVLVVEFSFGLKAFIHRALEEWKRWDGLEIRQSTIYYAGLLGQWDKCIVDQESDVPKKKFLYFFIDLGNSKLFIFIFVIL